MSDEVDADTLRDRQIRALLQHHDTLAQQIAELGQGQARVDGRLAKGDERMGSIETELRANSDVTNEVRDILNTFKGGMKVLGVLGTAARWMGYLATAGLAIWTLIYALTHGGELPGGKQ